MKDLMIKPETEDYQDNLSAVRYMYLNKTRCRFNVDGLKNSNSFYVLRTNKKMTQRDKDRIEEALFKGYLRTKRLSFTCERKHILKEILEISKTIKHFSINKLYNNLLVKRNRISKGTLYRTIKLLEDSKIVKKNRY